MITLEKLKKDVGFPLLVTMRELSDVVTEQGDVRSVVSLLLDRKAITPIDGEIIEHAQASGLEFRDASTQPHENQYPLIILGFTHPRQSNPRKKEDARFLCNVYEGLSPAGLHISLEGSLGEISDITLSHILDQTIMKIVPVKYAGNDLPNVAANLAGGNFSARAEWMVHGGQFEGKPYSGLAQTYREHPGVIHVQLIGLTDLAAQDLQKKLQAAHVSYIAFQPQP